jgi:hypothetical protein
MCWLLFRVCVQLAHQVIAWIKAGGRLLGDVFGFERALSAIAAGRASYRGAVCFAFAAGVHSLSEFSSNCHVYLLGGAFHRAGFYAPRIEVSLC